MEKIGLEFKLIIAYLIPGSIGLYAAAMLIPTIQNLLGGPTSVPQGSAIIQVLVLSVASGMIINAITWALVLPIIEWSCHTKRPYFDYSKLSKDNEAAMKNVIDNIFSYYQSYSNMLTALLLSFITYLFTSGTPRYDLLICGAFICIILFFAARDSLKKTDKNIEKILGYFEAVTGES